MDLTEFCCISLSANMQVKTRQVLRITCATSPLKYGNQLFYAYRVQDLPILALEAVNLIHDLAILGKARLTKQWH